MAKFRISKISPKCICVPGFPLDFFFLWIRRNPFSYVHYCVEEEYLVTEGRFHRKIPKNLTLFTEWFTEIIRVTYIIHKLVYNKIYLFATYIKT